MFELACFGNFGFLSKQRKLTVSYRPEIVFSVILVLKPSVTKLTKQANLISIADAVIFQNIGNCINPSQLARKSNLSFGPIYY